MKKYFYTDSKEKYGPFTLEELRQKDINNDTLIWFEGLDDWTLASELEDMKPILKLSPPPLPLSIEKQPEVFENTEYELEEPNEDTNVYPKLPKEKESSEGKIIQNAFNNQMSLTYVFVPVLCLVFGFTQASILYHGNTFQAFSSSALPILLTIIVSAIIGLPQLLIRKTYTKKSLVKTTRIIFVIIIAICYFSLIGSYRQAETERLKFEMINKKRQQEVDKLIKELETNAIDSIKLQLPKIYSAKHEEQLDSIVKRFQQQQSDASERRVDSIMLEMRKTYESVKDMNFEEQKETNEEQ